MNNKKSPIDNLFCELYGYYPNKAGQAYEIIVAAALKIVTGQNVKYDQHLRGQYSETDYQIDGQIEDKEVIIEAKDYTIDERKVGRPDLQKLQGALTDLKVKIGFFASATDYTKPAIKYANSSEQNPLHKQIKLFHVREATELDEKGRIKTIILTFIIVEPDFANGNYRYAWTEEAIKKFTEKDLIGKQLRMRMERFYKQDGSLDCLLEDLIRENQPIQVDLEDEFGVGCWLLPNRFVNYEDDLFEINGIEYKVPYTNTPITFRAELEGDVKILIKSEDGRIDKLLTDKQFTDLTFDKGNID
jgi:hypothetical protein